MKQHSLFRAQFIQGKTTNGSGGTKDRVSRYARLKELLDRDLTNQNWVEIDTRKVTGEKAKFNFIDLFSGAGGLSLGFKQAAFRIILSIEMDKDASGTMRRNFPEGIHFEKRMEDVSGAEIAEATKGKRIHVICGGPPCQGFSVAGLRNPQDPRNQLFREFIRIVKRVKPWYVVMENVPGILTMEKGRVYKEVLRQFDGAGYPDMSVRIMEAAAYGVPQLRTRAIFIGNKFGQKNPYPKEQYKSREYKTIESAIDDLKDLPFDPKTNHHWTRHSKKMGERIAKIGPGGSLYGSYRDAWKRQYKDAPAMTIKENHGGCHVHYEKNRVLSVREMARLQTFPDSFLFCGTHKRGYWQVGNAVPCLLAKNVALALRPNLKKIKAKPSHSGA